MIEYNIKILQKDAHCIYTKIKKLFIDLLLNKIVLFKISIGDFSYG